MRRLMLAIFATFALVGAACGDDAPVTVGGGPATSAPTTTAPTTTAPTTTEPLDSDAPGARLAAARARWAEFGSADYVLTLRELCFCPETVWIDTVVDGVVTSHEPGTEEGFYDPGPRSMEDLFDDVQAAIDAGYASLDLELDPETGALVSYWVDVDEMTADEEYGVEVVSLTIGDGGGVPTTGIAADLLVEDHPCGFGFAIGSTDQSLGLFVHTRGGEEPDVSSPVELPDDDWTAEVRVGRDLFANHCDDVVEVGEPEPVVTGIWTVVAGTLTVDAVSDDAVSGQSTAAGILTTAVVGSPAGERTELADIELRNDCWGCFAG